MDIQELKTKVKVLFGQNLSAEEIAALKQIIVRQEQVTLMEAKTADGKMLTYEGELAVGTAVNLVGEAGSTPAPDGEHMLEDGTKLVTVGGIVTEVVMPEQEEAAAPAGMPEMVQQMETKFSAQVKEIETSYAAKFKAQETELNSLKGEIKTLAAIFTKITEEPIEVVALSGHKKKDFKDLTGLEKYKLSKGEEI